jgi:hypothetical protein
MVAAIPFTSAVVGAAPLALVKLIDKRPTSA